MTGKKNPIILEKNMPALQTPPWTLCAAHHRRCSALVGLRRRSFPLVTLDEEPLAQGRGKASQRCPPRGAWRPAKERSYAWGAWRRPCISFGTTCLQITPREDNLSPRSRPSNTQSSTSTNSRTFSAMRKNTFTRVLTFRPLLSCCKYCKTGTWQLLFIYWTNLNVLIWILSFWSKQWK